MKLLSTVALVFGILTLSACSGIQRTPPIQVWPDMRLQPRFEAQATTGLFVDGRASRRRPDGVVARGHLLEDNVFNTGLQPDGMYIGKSPVEITPAVLAEGEWRFNTYCAPCHDRTGMGHGMVPQRWPAIHPADLTQDRLVQAADGDLFNVITYGRRTMPPYGAPNRAAERWAILAYVRVLQRAGNSSLNDVPEQTRAALIYKPGPPPIELPSVDDVPSKDGKAAPKAPEAKGGK
ncbi:MAG: cytochrome c [Acidobacteriota bacterium]